MERHSPVSFVASPKTARLAWRSAVTLESDTGTQKRKGTRVRDAKDDTNSRDSGGAAASRFARLKL